MKKHQGFTLVEILLVILIVSVLGFAGYYVWDKQQDKDTSSKERVATSQQSNSQNKHKAQKATQPSDREQIIGKVATLCTNEADQKLIETAVLDGSKGIVKIEDAFAYVSAGCESKDSSFAAYLQNKNDEWVIISSGQEAPRCDDFDGTGVPIAIVGECWDDAISDSRTPR